MGAPLWDGSVLGDGGHPSPRYVLPDAETAGYNNRLQGCFTPLP